MNLKIKNNPTHDVLLDVKKQLFDLKNDLNNPQSSEKLDRIEQYIANINIDQTENIDLKKTLADLKEAKNGLSEYLKILYPKEDTKIPAKYENLLPTLDKIIDSFSKVSDNYEEIKNVVLKPIKKSLLISTVLGIVGILLTVIMSNVYIVRDAKTFIQNFNISKQNAGVATIDKVNTILNVAPSVAAIGDRINDFKAKIILYPSDKEGGDLKNHFDKQFEEFIKSLKQKTNDEQEVQLSIIKMYTLLILNKEINNNDILEQNLIQANNLLTAAKLPAHRLEAKWIKTEIYRMLKKYQEAIVQYNEIAKEAKTKTSITVVDINDKKIEALSKLLENRLDEISFEMAKKTTRILLLNASGPVKDNIEKIAKQKLVDSGFAAENIITGISKDKNGIVFPYTRTENDVKMLEKVLRILYPKDNIAKMMRNRTSYSKIDNSYIKGKFDQKVNDKQADILIRLPGLKIN